MTQLVEEAPQLTHTFHRANQRCELLAHLEASPAQPCHIQANAVELGCCLLRANPRRIHRSVHKLVLDGHELRASKSTHYVTYL